MKKKYIFIISFIIVLVVISIITFFSIYNKELNYNVIIKDDVYSYYEEIKLSDVVNIEDGTISKDFIINTKKLGNNNVSFKYKVNNRNFTGSLEYEVVDNTDPLIISKSTFYTPAGSEIDILDSVMCADDYDSEPECEIVGEYDINKVNSYNLKIINTDSSNNSVSKDITLNVYAPEPVEDNIEPVITPIYLQDIINTHKLDSTKVGIDVSKWQGDINFEEVANSGVEFVIIRIGYGYDFDSYLDPKFHEYYEQAKAVNLDVGVYYYSYASSVDESIKQAQWVVKTLNKSDLELPIFFDWEEWHNFNDFDISITELNEMASSFINEVNKNDYVGGNYSSANYLRMIWNINTPTWLAHYTTNTDYEGNYYIWQLTDKGIVPGIDGYSDINVLYKTIFFLKINFFKIYIIFIFNI